VECSTGRVGYTVYAKLIPAAQSKLSDLPIGLANHVKLVRDVAAGDFMSAADVALAENLQAARMRCDMEAQGQDSTEVAGTASAATN
jgi:predicted homoserine dehydrogenase-like protein